MNQHQQKVNWQGIFLSLIISFIIFAGMSFTAMNAFAEASAQSWKWYAALIGGSISLLMLMAAVYGMFLVWKKHLNPSRVKA